MAGMVEAIAGKEEIFLTEESDVNQSFEYDQVHAVAPEILDAIEGRCSIDNGEIAVCVDFFKPFYPRSLADILEYADAAEGDYSVPMGWVRLYEPLFMKEQKVFVMAAAKFANLKSERQQSAATIEEFMKEERKRFFSRESIGFLPDDLKLCFLLVIKSRQDMPTITLASIAKQK